MHAAQQSVAGQVRHRFDGRQVEAPAAQLGIVGGYEHRHALCKVGGRIFHSLPIAGVHLAKGWYERDPDADVWATNQPPLAQCSMPQSSQIWTCTRVASHEDNSAALANTARSMTICVTARLAWPEEPAPRSLWRGHERPTSLSPH